MTNKEYGLILIRSLMICKATASVEAAKECLIAQKTWKSKNKQGPLSKEFHKQMTAICKKRIANG